MFSQEARLSDKAMENITKRANLEQEAARLLTYIVSEWESDPMSTQCFDLRLVERATEIVNELKKTEGAPW